MKSFPHHVLCKTSSVADGNMDFRFGDTKEVIRSRTAFLKKFDIPYENHIAMRCDHTDILTLVTAFHASRGAKTQEDQVHSEVLITQERNIALMLFTADCLPVSFFDPVTRTIALAHVSRKTLTLSIPELTIDFLQNTCGTHAEDICIEIGPHIKKESYAFPIPLDETSEELKEFIEEKDGMAHIDLLGGCLDQFLEKGVKLENIIISPIDTAASEDHYSYYRLKRGGKEKEARMANILMLR